MIHEVDRALRTIINSADGKPEGTRVSFDAPTREWADGLDGTPTVNLCLYDIREDVKQRKVGQAAMRNDRGQIIGWRPPPRIYKLSYIGSCWTGETEKDHEMLGWLLNTFSAIKQIPASVLTGSLALWGVAGMETAQPDAAARPLPASLTAMSGEARPNLDVVVSAPVVFPIEESSGIVLEELILNAQGKRGQPYERVQRRMMEGIAELERTPPGHPLVERGRATEPQVEEELRDDDPENL